MTVNRGKPTRQAYNYGPAKNKKMSDRAKEIARQHDLATRVAADVRRHIKETNDGN
jgi:hypothetical protein